MLISRSTKSIRAARRRLSHHGDIQETVSTLRQQDCCAEKRDQMSRSQGCPERAKQQICSALSGLPFVFDSQPRAALHGSRRFALPWADMLLPLAGRKLMYKRQAPSPSAENRQAESLSYSSNSLFTPKRQCHSCETTMDPAVPVTGT